MEEIIKNEEQVNKAMEMATEAVGKKTGVKTGLALLLTTLIVGAGYAAVKGVQKLIEIKENHDFEPGNTEADEPMDADFEPAE